MYTQTVIGIDGNRLFNSLCNRAHSDPKYKCTVFTQSKIVRKEINDIICNIKQMEIIRNMLKITGDFLIRRNQYMAYPDNIKQDLPTVPTSVASQPVCKTRVQHH